MKKFISMVMAAAMVVSLVPATAFAAGDLAGTAKIVDDIEWTEAEAEDHIQESVEGPLVKKGEAPELKIKVTDVDYRNTDSSAPKAEVTLVLDNAKFVTSTDPNAVVEEDGTITLVNYGSFQRDGKVLVPFAKTMDVAGTEGNDKDDIKLSYVVEDDNEITFTFEGFLEEDDCIYFNLTSVLDDEDAGTQATVSVKGDIVEASDLVYATILDKGIEVSIDDTTDVAEEEIVTLGEAIEVEPVVGDNFAAVMKADEKIKLKLNSGFEFVYDKDHEATIAGEAIPEEAYDDNEIEFKVSDITGKDLLKLEDLKIEGLIVEATSAKAGDVATVSVDFGDCDAVKVDVAVVVEEGVSIALTDEDEDVPEMWSGVAVDTKFLTDDDDNKALAFTLEESVAGAYSNKDEIELVLPEGVWVVEDGVEISVEGGTDMSEGDWDTAFENAYKEGDHASFIFEKRTIDETTDNEAFEIEVVLTLVADPGFVGDVVVEMLVDGESVGEATIATFKAPLVVEAQSNDLKIDYRNTEVGSDIVVKEAEAGLWAKGLTLGFEIDDHDVMEFEDDVEYTVNTDDSDMEVDGEDKYVEFTVDEESDEEAAVVTISNLSLFMERNIPAGAYDLTMNGGKSTDKDKNVFVEYNSQKLFAFDAEEKDCEGTGTVAHKCDAEIYINDVQDYSDVVKEGFVNVVTAGREADDASFTTKVVVPVGESYIVAGEQTIALDVPAYVSEAGYTMLPVRAVATGLGINNNNVLWDQTTKTVTILYGQRIITMVAGQKVVNVNGSVIPASATVEIVDGRAFLPMRDLATALGVTDITWDAATKTATLNGNA